MVKQKGIIKREAQGVQSTQSAPGEAESLQALCDATSKIFRILEPTPPLEKRLNSDQAARVIDKLCIEGFTWTYQVCVPYTTEDAKAINEYLESYFAEKRGVPRGARHVKPISNDSHYIQLPKFMDGTPIPLDFYIDQGQRTGRQMIEEANFIYACAGYPMEGCVGRIAFAHLNLWQYYLLFDPPRTLHAKAGFPDVRNGNYVIEAMDALATIRLMEDLAPKQFYLLKQKQQRMRDIILGVITI